MNRICSRRLAGTAGIASMCFALAGAAPGQTIGFTDESLSLPFGGATLAFAPDGTLFAAPGFPGPNNSILAIAPDGSQTTIVLGGGQTLDSPGGATFDPVSGLLLVTDNEGNGDGEGNLLGIDPTTGATQVLASGIDFIDDVAVRSTGEVFVTNAVGGGSGTVLQIDTTNGTATTVVTGLDLAAGLGFDTTGDLIFQDVDSTTFLGSVSELAITETSGGLSFGAVTPLASGLSAGFDLAVDSEDDVFVTGSGGVFELDRDGTGAFTGGATLFEAGGFSTEIAFLSGGVAFEAFGVPVGVLPQLAFLPEFGSQTVTVVTVPEPTAAALLGLGGWLLARRRRAGEGK